MDACVFGMAYLNNYFIGNSNEREFGMFRTTDKLKNSKPRDACTQKIYSCFFNWHTVIILVVWWCKLSPQLQYSQRSNASTNRFTHVYISCKNKGTGNCVKEDFSGKNWLEGFFIISWNRSYFVMFKWCVIPDGSYGEKVSRP